MSELVTVKDLLHGAINCINTQLKLTKLGIDLECSPVDDGERVFWCRYRK